MPLSSKRVIGVTAVIGLLVLTLVVSHATTPNRELGDFDSRLADRAEVRTPSMASSAMVSDDPDIEALWVGTTRWMTGYNYGLETFFGSIGQGRDFLGGSSLANNQYVPVKIEFSNSTTTLCRTFRRDLGWISSGVGTFPGAAYDISNPGTPRRLNLCFIEDAGQGAVNLTWDPNTTELGKREYLLVMLSSYDGTGNTYNGANPMSGGTSMDILYSWWPRVETGFSLLQVLPASIEITPYYINHFRSIPDDQQATLTWLHTPDPDSFRVFGDDVVPPADLWVGTVPGTARTVSAAGLANGVNHYYRVEAFDGGQIVGKSREILTVPGVYRRNLSLEGAWHERSTYGGIWGYVDSASGNEYALLCCREEGVSIIDVDVTPPVEVGFMPTLFPGTDAKEVQVYRHYAIVVKENEDIQIFNIANVTNPILVATIDPGNNGSHTCLVDGNYLYSCGNHEFGGLRIYNIINPAAPAFVGQYQPFYFHDIAIRKDTIYAFGIFGEGTRIIDVTNKSAPDSIGHINYPGQGPHNGAITADGDYIFIGDEIGMSGNHTRCFNISDLDNIALASEIIIDPQSIAHNCYIRDNLLYIGHYTEGVRVWNIADPDNPFEVAYYDTYHPAGVYGYDGVWTAYPLLPSGKIIVSDLTTGLWVFNLDGTCTCPCAADPECDGPTTVLDVTRTINVAFRGEAAVNDPGCPYTRTNVDCDATTTVLDVTKVINVAFRGASEATQYCNACP